MAYIALKYLIRPITFDLKGYSIKPWLCFLMSALFPILDKKDFSWKEIGWFYGVLGFVVWLVIMIDSAFYGYIIS
jgi:hypothetical protein